MSQDYCDYLIDLLSPWKAVTVKKMFGGYGVYHGGLMFGLVAESDLYFKVADENRADYQEAGSAPFSYQSKGKRVTLSYWQVPPAIMDDPDALSSWAEKAYAVAIKAKKKKR